MVTCSTFIRNFIIFILRQGKIMLIAFMVIQLHSFAECNFNRQMQTQYKNKGNCIANLFTMVKTGNSEISKGRVASMEQ